MAQIAWNESYAIGIETIDQQHKKWVDLYNELDRVLAETNPREFASAKIQALQSMQEYVQYHFHYEENYMKSIDYPELPQHWRLHKNFDYKVFNYLRQLEQGHLILNTELIAVIRNWLIDHILHEDQKIKTFLTKELPQDD